MMCTTTNSAIQAARVREEKQTLLTKPRRVGSGGHAGREQSRAPHAGRRRALRPAPEVSLGSHCPRTCAQRQRSHWAHIPRESYTNLWVDTEILYQFVFGH